MSSKFENAGHLTPVTAVEVVRRNDKIFYFVGSGPFITAYRDGEKTFLFRERVLGSENVHGVVSSSSGQDATRFVIWGGCKVRLANVHFTSQADSDATLKVGHAFEAPDRVFCAALRPQNPYKSQASNLSVTLVTAHNALVHLEQSTLTEGPRVEQLTSESRSLLYSAHAVWLSRNHLMIASGSVFGEILISSCYVDPEEDIVTSRSTEILLHQIFTGHEGSIFGVSISHELSLVTSPTPKRLLFSCSDDRTIRAWDVSSYALTEAASERGDDKPLDELRETGFGGDGLTSQYSEGNAPQCVAKAWGHLSRIWRVHVLESASDLLADHQKWTVLSYGEDATCQMWDLTANSVDNGHEWGLAHRKTLSLHVGKNIWSHAVLKLDDDRSLLATGGADGGVMSLRLGSEHYGQNKKVMQHDSFNPKDVKAFTLRNADTVYGVTIRGQIVVGRIQAGELQQKPSMHDMRSSDAAEDDQIQWKVAAYESSLEEYAAISTGPESALFACASTDGEIITFAEGGGSRIISEGANTVTSLHCLDTGDCIKIIAAKRSDPHLDVYRLSPEDVNDADMEDNLEDGLEDNLRFSPAQLLLLPVGFFITSATYAHGHFIIGSRNGTLAIYQDLSEIIDEVQSVEPMAVFERFNGSKEAMTNITVMPLPGRDERVYQILTTARNGAYTISSIDLRTDDVTCTVLHSLSLPFGPMIEGASFVKGEMLLYGFRSRNFVLWNETRQQEVMTVDCAGAHRNWAFYPDRISGGGTFTWTQASQFRVRKQVGAAQDIVQPGGHGREIKAAAISNGPLVNANPLTAVLATGAEDTVIRFFIRASKSEAGFGGFECHRALRGHKTGLQKLEWSPCNRYLFSSAGSEEFFVWRVRWITGFGLGVVREAACPQATEESDLRVMNFTVQVRSESVFDLFIVYSDSSIRKFAYACEEKRFALLWEGSYGSRCLTEVYAWKCGRGMHMVTAGTDGVLALWDQALGSSTATQSGAHALRQYSQHKPHQNTVMSMAATTVKNRGLLVFVTGGDDNALAFSLTQTEPNQDSHEPHFTTLLVRKAHAAAVTAVCQLEDSTSTKAHSPLWFASAGNDQRLRIWKLSNYAALNTKGIEVVNTATVSTSVADVSSLVSMPRIPQNENDALNVSIIICGVGIEMWNLYDQNLAKITDR